MENDKAKMARIFQLLAEHPISEDTRNLSNQLLYISFFTLLLDLQMVNIQFIKSYVQSVEVLGFAFGKGSYNLILGVALLCCLFYAILLWFSAKWDKNRAIHMAKLQAQIEELPEKLANGDVYGNRQFDKVKKYEAMYLDFEQKIKGLERKLAESEENIDEDMLELIRERIFELRMTNPNVLNKATEAMNRMGDIIKWNNENIIPMQQNLDFRRRLTIGFPIAMASLALILAAVVFALSFFS
ncbi:hypothetical protein [Dyadobacter sp. LHD-138]|uniref:hypothetical protein n=1 Tax=Dyadobacter sp. LHD-138 TaxID=3071413 RepID=UPI0027E08D39|nr:hypothetical protein [Dyadobacter sp. LHD-138]MDQ6479879.1 hypothetical protein [Dyadobacter sp. LHD-138]